MKGNSNFYSFIIDKLLANYFRAAMRGKAAKKLSCVDFEEYNVAVQWRHSGNVVVLPSKTLPWWPCILFHVGFSGGT